jgi:hypothetical protein
MKKQIFDFIKLKTPNLKEVLGVKVKDYDDENLDEFALLYEMRIDDQEIFISDYKKVTQSILDTIPTINFILEKKIKPKLLKYFNKKVK